MLHELRQGPQGHRRFHNQPSGLQGRQRIRAHQLRLRIHRRFPQPVTRAGAAQGGLRLQPEVPAIRRRVRKPLCHPPGLGKRQRQLGACEDHSLQRAGKGVGGLQPARRSAGGGVAQGEIRVPDRSPQGHSPGGAVGSSQCHRNENIRHRKRAGMAALHRNAVDALRRPGDTKPGNNRFGDSSARGPAAVRRLHLRYPA